ncbi:hypothetical protein B484DRAFT_462701 [Ochromonadaceae sp. CCMP2298]|nr:hypothetical protein B484DRAFT_462701 [Ochromonadaceae sp. CCMP2298]
MYPMNVKLRECAEARSKRSRIDWEEIAQSNTRFLQSGSGFDHIPTGPLPPGFENGIMEAIRVLSDPSSPRMEEYVDANEIGAPIATEVIDVDADEVDTLRGVRAHTPSIAEPPQTAISSKKQKRSGRGNDRHVEGAGGQGHSHEQVCALGNQVFGKPTSAATKAILAKKGWQKAFVRGDVLVLQAIHPLGATIIHVNKDKFTFNRIVLTKVGKEVHSETVFFDLPKDEIDPILPSIMRANTGLVGASVEFTVKCDVHVNGTSITLHIPPKFSSDGQKGLIVPITKDKLVQSVIGEPPIALAAPLIPVLVPVTAERLIDPDEEEYFPPNEAY